MTDTHGTVYWTELMTRDVEAAKRYYGALCGWTFTSMPMASSDADYVLGMRGEQPVVGIMDMADMPGQDAGPPSWMSYFAVDDVDAAVAATTAAGGQILRAPLEVPNTGRIAILSDPSGAVIGVMTPEPMPDS